MRSSMPIVAICLIMGLTVLISIPHAEADPAWVIDDHVVIEEQDLTIERNITITDGGWLEILGSSLRFNCSHPLEYLMKVGVGGRLTIAPSSTGRGCEVRLVEARYPSRIEAAWSDAVSIQELTMSDCGMGVVPAIQIDNVDGPVIRNCIFRNCTIPVSVRTCSNVLIDGNRMHGSLLGLQIWSSIDCQVLNNQITDSHAGMGIQFSSSMVVRRNSISAFDGSGMNLYSVDNTLLQSNSIEVLSFGAIEITQCKLLTIEGHLIRGLPSGTWGTSGISISRSSFVRVQNCTLWDLSEGVVISAQFGDREERNILSSVHVSNCDIGVNISSVANMVLGSDFKDCRLGIRMGPNRYGDPSQENLVDGCSFDNCTIGILSANSRMQRIERTGFYGCDEAVSGRDVSGDLIANCTVSEFETAAISITRGEMEIRNCTIEGGPVSLLLLSGSTGIVRQSTFHTVDMTAHVDDGSTLELHNSTHVRAYDIGIDSEMSIFWDVEVVIGLASGRRTAVNGSLVVRDSGDVVVSDERIHFLPSERDLEVMESRHRGGSVDQRTPHRLKAASQGMSAMAEAAITRYLRVIMLIDDIPPSIMVQSPISNTSVDGQVLLRGYCNDNYDEKVDIELRLDGKPLFSGESEWDLLVDLEDGLHNIEYVATDDNHNELRTSQHLLVDTLPPVLTLTSPPTNPYLLADDELAITGSVEDGVGVSLDGVERPLKAGTFSKILYLPEDDAYSFEVVAWDGLHNTRSLVLTIIRDMTPPLLLLDEYPSVTGDTPLVLGGTTDPSGSRVSLAGQDVPLLPGGRFTLILDLDEGLNKIAIMAVDEAGNTDEVEIEVILDIEAVFEIVWPLNGTVVQSNEIVVLVHGELGAQYRIEPLGWADADEDGYCSLPMVLYEPVNEVVVSMRDRVGNLDAESVTVFYAPRVVSHETSSPDWAGMIIITVILGTLTLSILYVRSRHKT